MKTMLRAFAVVVATAAFFDPALARRQPAPVAVDIALPPASDAEHARAAELRTRVLAAMPPHVRVDSGAEPSAIVAIGNAELPARLPSRVFTLRPDDEATRLQVTRLHTPEVLLAGQVGELAVAVQSRGLRGTNVTLTLEQRGVIVARAKATPDSDSASFEVPFTIAPPSTGPHKLRVIARAAGVADAMADTTVTVRERPLRVLVFEPRPSWPAAFVRRALEADALFNVSSVARTSRRIATTTDASHEAIALGDVDVFDCVIVGAPDAMTEADIAAVRRFAAVRGGPVWLLPDRSMPDALLRRLGLPQFDEVLLEQGTDVQTSAGALRASELLISRETDGTRILGTTQYRGARRPVMFEIPHGLGGIFFSGALDAWRFRGATKDAGLTWGALVADAGSVAPPPLTVSVEPRIARPGEEVTITAALRQTEFQRSGSRVVIPAVQASATTREGVRQVIRLWPSSTPGVFEGTLKPSATGDAVIEVRSRHLTADVLLMVTEDVVRPHADRTRELDLAVTATGGAAAADVAQLRHQVERLEPAVVQTITRPMRSAWWIAPFAVLLCAEWTLRRKDGLR